MCTVFLRIISADFLKLDKTQQGQIVFYMGGCPSGDIFLICSTRLVSLSRLAWDSSVTPSDKTMIRMESNC